MDVTKYSGPLPAAVAFAWKGELLGNTLTNKLKDQHYLTINDAVTDFTVEGTVGGRTVRVRRKATKANKFYDALLGTYVCAPLSGADLDDLIKASPGLVCHVDLTFSYATFFDAMLKDMTRTDGSPKNFGDPDDQKVILDTFEHAVVKGEVKIKYKTATKTISALPCKLIETEITPAVGSGPPSVKLLFELDFLTGVDAARREAMRALIAMDWTGLAREGTETTSHPSVPIWDRNVTTYLVNHTDIKRGEKLRSDLVSKHKGKTAAVLASDLRNDIDKLLVTANHWGDKREDPKKEYYQRMLSDLFGTLHQKTWLSSPVHFARAISKGLKLSLKQKAALALQYGTGHCGEHATVSFTILQDIIDAPGALVSNAVYAGNANIDHAFVVYNLDLQKVVWTKATAKSNRRVKPDEEISVWNLRAAITANKTKVGYVMDPYLDQSVMKPTAQQLLHALHSKRRQNAKQDTDFLAFQHEHPSSFTVDDIRSNTEQQRKLAVKNV